jgi:hypothetical protein
MKLRKSAVLLAALVVSGLGWGASGVSAADGVMQPVPLEGHPLTTPDTERANAFTTITHPLTPTAAEKRVAAVTYMDDALALLELAHQHLRESASSPAVRRMALSELMAASGKVSTAQLLLFHDKEAARRVRPLAMQIELAERLCMRDPMMASRLIERDRPALAAVYTSTLATMGGGAGRVPMEPLKHR